MSSYFDYKSLAWKKMKTENNLTAAHRGLYWAIFERWNNHFFKKFEASKHELMEMSGISSEKTYFLLLNDLIKFNYLDCQKGANRFKKSTITILSDHFKPAKTAGIKEDSKVETTEVIYASRVDITELDSSKVNATTVNFTALDSDSTVDITEQEANAVNITELDSSAVDSTRVNITELEANRAVDITGLKKSSAVNTTELYIGKDILSSYSTKLKTTNNIIYNSEDEFEKNVEGEKYLGQKMKAKQVEEVLTTFLQSEVGTLESLTNYIVNESVFPTADPEFYFNAIREWRDKQTGLEPLRQNWKSIINLFIRNDISRNGHATTKQHLQANGQQSITKQSNNRYFSSNSRENIQRHYADLDDTIKRFIAIRNR